MIKVTRPLPSQLTFFHLQQSVLAVQPDGAGLRAARSLDMTAASSAAPKDEKVIRRDIMKEERQSRVLSRPILSVRDTGVNLCRERRGPEKERARFLGIVRVLRLRERDGLYTYIRVKGMFCGFSRLTVRWMSRG